MVLSGVVTVRRLANEPIMLKLYDPDGEVAHVPLRRTTRRHGSGALYWIGAQQVTGKARR